MPGARNGPSGPPYRVAANPAGYKHGLREGAQERTDTKGHRGRVTGPLAHGGDPKIGQGEEESDGPKKDRGPEVPRRGECGRLAGVLPRYEERKQETLGKRARGRAQGQN